MITYNIGTRVGPIGGGIPSEDVAIAMLVDEFRYVQDDDDQLRRFDVHVVVEAHSDDDCEPRPCALDTDGRVEACVNTEHRCDHCGQVLPYGFPERPVL